MGYEHRKRTSPRIDTFQTLLMAITVPDVSNFIKHIALFCLIRSLAVAIETI